MKRCGSGSKLARCILANTPRGKFVIGRALKNEMVESKCEGLGSL